MSRLILEFMLIHKEETESITNVLEGLIKAVEHQNILLKDMLLNVKE